MAATTGNPKIDKLIKQYETLKKELEKAGYDIVKDFESLKDAVDPFLKQEGYKTIGEFLHIYNEEMKKFNEKVKKTKNKRKKETQKVTQEVEGFQKVIQTLNKNIIETLPETEKEYEKLSIALEEERNTFKKTYGAYSNYSKKIHRELENILAGARKAQTFKEARQFLKQNEILNKIIQDNFEDSAEKANLIAQIQRQNLVLEKELEKKSGIFSRTKQFIGKNKVNIASLVSIASTNNPIAMWLTESALGFGERAKQRKQQLQDYKLNQLYNLRSTMGGRTLEDFSLGEKRGGRSMAEGSRRTMAISTQEGVQELKEHTILLRQIVSVLTKTNQVQEEVKDANEALKESLEQQAVEQKLEGGKKAGAGFVAGGGMTPKPGGNRGKGGETESAGGDGFDVSDAILTTWIAKDIGGGVFQKLLKTKFASKIFGKFAGKAGLAAALGGAIGGAAKFGGKAFGRFLGPLALGYDVYQTNKEVEEENTAKYGVYDKRAALVGKMGLPLAGMATGAAIGSVVPVAGTAVGAGIGYAAGSVANALSPETTREIARGVQVIQDWNTEGLMLRADVVDTFYKQLNTIVGVVDKSAAKRNQKITARMQQRRKWYEQYRAERGLRKSPEKIPSIQFSSPDLKPLKTDIDKIRDLESQGKIPAVPDTVINGIKIALDKQGYFIDEQGYLVNKKTGYTASMDIQTKIKEQLARKGYVIDEYGDIHYTLQKGSRLYRKTHPREHRKDQRKKTRKRRKNQLARQLSQVQNETVQSAQAEVLALTKLGNAVQTSATTAPIPQPAPTPASEQNAIGGNVVDQLYAALATPETGSIEKLALDDPRRFIRTKAGEGTSSAYGPVQITKTLMQGFIKNNAGNLTPEELDYATRFVEQGRTMLKGSWSDPTYGAGGHGNLSGEKDRVLYESVAKKLIQSEYNRVGGDVDKFTQAWRGVSEQEDPNYYRQVRTAMRGQPSSSAQTYLAQNETNQQIKLASATTPGQTVVNNISTPPAQNRGLSAAQTPRGAPRGNEYTLQAALNADYCGSTA